MSDQRKGYQQGKGQPKGQKDYGKGQTPPRKEYKAEPPPKKGYQEETPPPDEYKPETPPPDEYKPETPPPDQYQPETPPPDGYAPETPPPEDYPAEEPAPEPECGEGNTPPPPADGYGTPPPPPGGGYGTPPPPGGGYGTPPPPGTGYGGEQDGGYGGETCAPVDPLCDDDPEPGDSLRDFKIGKARAETAKAIEPILEAEALAAPDYVAKKKALEAAYAAATAESDSPDNLRRKYCNADKAYLEAVNYMLAKAPGQPSNLLEQWVDRNLCEKGAPVRKVLIERRQVGIRLRAHKGPRELALQDAHERTEQWAARWTSWSDPVKNIDAAIKSYQDRIGTLKDLFNDQPTADKAIFEFWFEVAPLHLGLRPDPVDEANEPGLGLIRSALADFVDVRDRLSIAAHRSGGGLYLIDSGELAAHRAWVLEAWEEAARAEAVAKADYDIWPDSAAKLDERYAALKDDKWFAQVKTALGPPAAA